MPNDRSDQQNLFETFAKKLCDYAMRKYVIPYMQNHGVIQTYRATILSKDTAHQTMTVERPFDRPVTIPYSNGASTLDAGDSCVVFALGQPYNAIVAADGKLNFTSVLNLLRTTKIDFSEWDNGLFFESIEGGELLTYQVVFDENGNPIKIIAADGHETEVVW